MIIWLTIGGALSRFDGSGLNCGLLRSVFSSWCGASGLVQKVLLSSRLENSALLDDGDDDDRRWNLLGGRTWSGGVSASLLVQWGPGLPATKSDSTSLINIGSWEPGPVSLLASLNVDMSWFPWDGSVNSLSSMRKLSTGLLARVSSWSRGLINNPRSFARV